MSSKVNLAHLKCIFEIVCQSEFSIQAVPLPNSFPSIDSNIYHKLNQFTINMSLNLSQQADILAKLYSGVSGERLSQDYNVAE